MHGDLRAHRAGRQVEGGVLATALRRPVLQQVDRRVVAEPVIADLRCGHGAAHGIGWLGDGVRAKVDRAIHGALRPVIVWPVVRSIRPQRPAPIAAVQSSGPNGTGRAEQRGSERRMKALVKARAEPGLWLQDVPVPGVGRDDVLIRVLRTGVCGTDLHIYEWDGWAQANVPVPLVDRKSTR